MLSPDLMFALVSSARKEPITMRAQWQFDRLLTDARMRRFDVHAIRLHSSPSSHSARYTGVLSKCSAIGGRQANFRRSTLRRDSA